MFGPVLSPVVDVWYDETAEGVIERIGADKVRNMNKKTQLDESQY